MKIPHQPVSIGGDASCAASCAAKFALGALWLALVLTAWPSVAGAQTTNPPRAVRVTNDVFSIIVVWNAPRGGGVNRYRVCIAPKSVYDETSSFDGDTCSLDSGYGVDVGPTDADPTPRDHRRIDLLDTTVEYVVAVRSNAATNSAWASWQVDGTLQVISPLPQTPPLAPTAASVVANDNRNDAFTVRWTNNFAIGTLRTGNQVCVLASTETVNFDTDCTAGTRFAVGANVSTAAVHNDGGRFPGTPITAGAAYAVAVRATAARGNNGEWVQAARNFRPGRTNPPRTVRATNDVFSITVNWDAPDGGFMPRGYRVCVAPKSVYDETSSFDGGTCTLASGYGADVALMPRNYTRSELMDATVEYVVAVRSNGTDGADATNSGWASWQVGGTLQVISPLPVATPTNVMAEPGDNAITVSWTVSAGTPAPSGYEVCVGDERDWFGYDTTPDFFELLDPLNGCAFRFADGSPDATLTFVTVTESPTTVSGGGAVIANGNAYLVAVRAIHADGPSGWATLSGTVRLGAPSDDATLRALTAAGTVDTSEITLTPDF